MKRGKKYDERLASVIDREEEEKIKSKGDLSRSQRLEKIKTKEGLAAAFGSGRRKNVRVSFFLCVFLVLLPQITK